MFDGGPSAMSSAGTSPAPSVYGLPADDRRVMSLARVFPSPEQSSRAASSKSCE